MSKSFTGEQVTDLRSLAYDLMGTCQSLDALKENYDNLHDVADDDAEEWIEANTETRLCSQCGWWSDDCDDNEDGDGPYCQQCREENGDDDD